MSICNTYLYLSPPQLICWIRFSLVKATDLDAGSHTMKKCLGFTYKLSI